MFYVIPFLYSSLLKFGEIAIMSFFILSVCPVDAEYLAGEVLNSAGSEATAESVQAEENGTQKKSIFIKPRHISSAIKNDPDLQNFVVANGE
jgi:hypothetical protein